MIDSIYKLGDSPPRRKYAFHTPKKPKPHFPFKGERANDDNKNLFDQASRQDINARYEGGDMYAGPYSSRSSRALLISGS